MISKKTFAKAELTNDPLRHVKRDIQLSSRMRLGTDRANEKAVSVKFGSGKPSSGKFGSDKKSRCPWVGGIRNRCPTVKRLTGHAD